MADAAGNPLTGKYNLEFRIYEVPTEGEGVPLWEELWTGGKAVDVSDGLFNVMLRSINPTLAEPIEGHDELYLGITVGSDDEMTPRVQLGSVRWAMQASTVPDGSITRDKIATGAVTTTHVVDGAVTTAKLAPDTTVPFSRRPNSYAYVVGMSQFWLRNGNYCWGYVPTEHPEERCPITYLAKFFFLRFVARSPNGIIRAGNNSLDIARWGYAHTYFLNNPGSARPLNITFKTCNDVAIYVVVGTATHESLVTEGTLVYHRFPGSDADTGCRCDEQTPSITVPSGTFRLVILTRGSDCASYLMWPVSKLATGS